MRAKIVGLAILYLQRNDAERASGIIQEIKKLFEGRHFKSIQVQLRSLESRLGEKDGLGVIHVAPGKGDSVVTYDNRTLLLKNESPSEKLLLLLAKRKFSDKANIVKTLYDRQYDGEQDDKLIERVDLALQLDAVDQVNRNRHAFFAQGIQKGILQRLAFGHLVFSLFSRLIVLQLWSE